MPPAAAPRGFGAGRRRVHRPYPGRGADRGAELRSPAARQHREGARRHRCADGGGQRDAPRELPEDRRRGTRPHANAPQPGPTQCHDITVYPAIGLAGGACGGYGLLLDISDPANPMRIAAVADSNFSYWHSATFNNDGTKILFSDEWGGGMQPKCRDDRQAGVGCGRASSRSRTGRWTSRATTRCRRRRPRGELRGAQRLADPDPGARRHGPGAGTRAASRSSTGPTRRRPREIAYHRPRPRDSSGSSSAAPGRCTGTTASS